MAQSLLDIMKRVARRCGLTPPTSVMGSNDETWLQMVEWAQDVVEELSERHDWRALHKTQTITGDGSTVNFALPSDYARLAKMPALSRSGSTSTFDPIGPVGPPVWITQSTILTGTSTPIFQIENGYLSMDPAPATGNTFVLSYQSSKPVYSTSGGSPGPILEWANDTDTPIVPDRLVRLGVVAKWKMAKGFDGAKFLDDFERSFEMLASSDWGLMASDTSFGDLGDLSDPVSEPFVSV